MVGICEFWELGGWVADLVDFVVRWDFGFGIYAEIIVIVWHEAFP